MANHDQETPEIQLFLESAEEAKRIYDWQNACESYEKAITILPEDNPKQSAHLYFMMAESYYFASYCAKTFEDSVSLIKLSAKSYKKSAQFHQSIADEARVLICSAMVDFIDALLSQNIQVFNSKYIEVSKYLKKAVNIYAQTGNKPEYARALVLQFYISSFSVSIASKHEDVLIAFEKVKPLLQKSWDLLKETSGVQNHIQLFHFIWGNVFWMIGASYNLPVKYWSKEVYWLEKIAEELSEILKDSDNDLLLAMSYLMNAHIKWYLTRVISESDKEVERRKAFRQCVKYVDKGLLHAQKTGLNFIFSNFHFGRATSLLWGQLTVDLKQIITDLDLCVKYEKLQPHIFLRINSISSGNTYTELAHRAFFPLNDRIKFTQKSIEISETVLLETKSGESAQLIPQWAQLYAGMCLNYVHLAEFTSETTEQEKFIEKALNEAEKVKDIASNFKGGGNQSYSYYAIWVAYKSLADLEVDLNKKIDLLNLAVDAAESFLENPVSAVTGIFSARFRLGDLYQEIGILSNDEAMQKKAYMTFLEALEDSKEREYPYMVASAHQRIAMVEEIMGDHVSSAEHYIKSKNAYKGALPNISNEKMIKKVEELCEYTHAWHLIELARDCHDQEEFLRAKNNYEQSATLLKDLPTYYFESAYYSAWAKLEEAIQSSKKEIHAEAAKQFKTASEAFNKAIMTLNDAKKATLNSKENDRISKLEKAARLRKNYSYAMASIEKGKSLGKEGKKIQAAKEYHKSVITFEEICASYELDSGKEEYLARLKLSQALEKLELAENENDPEGFRAASVFFEAASSMFPEKRMRMISSGNSAFCKAMEHGCRFDKAEDINTKSELYSVTKKNLRNAASFYEKGNMVGGSEWALATSTYFDGAWHLIKADEIIELEDRKKLLQIASGYLKSAAKLFGRAGYAYKEEEILSHVKMVDEESKILVSAMGTIVKPDISQNISGHISPSLPEESSSPTSISEMRRYSQQAESSEELKNKKRYELLYHDLLEQYPQVQKGKCRVGIAQIGSLEDFFEEKTNGLFGLAENRLSDVRLKIKGMIEKAHDNKVDILLFPEMTIDLNYEELLNDVNELAKKYDMYIVPGSYHDLETGTNVCRVIGPEGILWEQKKHIPAIIGFGGRKIEENINTGSIKKVTICNTRFGRIAIAICRDFLDMDLRVELKNFPIPVDIILNPALTPVTVDFEAAHFEARRSVYAYCFFCNFAAFGNSLVHSPEKDRTKMMIPPQEENLIYKDIDLFNLRSERKKWEKIRDKEVRFIQSTR